MDGRLEAGGPKDLVFSSVRAATVRHAPASRPVASARPLSGPAHGGPRFRARRTGIDAGLGDAGRVAGVGQAEVDEPNQALVRDQHVGRLQVPARGRGARARAARCPAAVTLARVRACVHVPVRACARARQCARARVRARVCV